MIVLGIETSCDETAAAVVTDERRVLSDIVLSQSRRPRAATAAWCRRSPRAAMSSISTSLIAERAGEAGVGFAELDGVAATAGRA